MAVAVGGVSPVTPLNAADPIQLGIDVIQLVDDGIQLRDPRIGARIQMFLAGSIERLIAEAWQRKRDQVLDWTIAEHDFRRLRHEPFGAPGNALRGSIAPEIISRLTRGQREAMARGERAFRRRT